MDPHLHRARADPVDEREGLFAGQCGRGGVLRPSQAGVLPQEELPGRDDRRVHRDARRVHGLVPRQAHQDRIRHEHHGQTHPARARRLKPSGTLTNDHTDNEVQQNVTTPGYSLDLSVFSLCKVVLSGGSILTQMCTVCCQRLCSFAGQLPGNPG